MSQNVEKHMPGAVHTPPPPTQLVPPGRPWREPKFIKKVKLEIGGSKMPKIGIRAPLGSIL